MATTRRSTSWPTGPWKPTRRNRASATPDHAQPRRDVQALRGQAVADSVGPGVGVTAGQRPRRQRLDARADRAGQGWAGIGARPRRVGRVVDVDGQLLGSRERRDWELPYQTSTCTAGSATPTRVGRRRDGRSIVAGSAVALSHTAAGVRRRRTREGLVPGFRCPEVSSGEDLVG